jgi:hypothetical protein
MADLHLQHETGGGAAVTTTKNYYNWEVADMNQVYEAVDIECGRIQSLNYWVIYYLFIYVSIINYQLLLLLLLCIDCVFISGRNTVSFLVSTPS